MSGTRAARYLKDARAELETALGLSLKATIWAAPEDPLTFLAQHLLAQVCTAPPCCLLVASVGCILLCRGRNRAALTPTRL